MNPVVILLLLLTAILAIQVLLYQPFNPVPIMSTLTVFFALFPAFLFAGTGEILSYSWRNFIFMSNLLYEKENMRDGLLTLTLVTFSFTFGAAASSWMLRDKRLDLFRQYSADPSDEYILSGHLLKGNKGLLVAGTILLALWIIAAIFHLSAAGWSIRMFLLPIRGAEGERSGYMRVLLMMMPPALVAIGYWYYGRWKTPCTLFTVLAIISAFSTSQRREGVTIALFILSLHVFLDMRMFENVTISRYMYWRWMFKSEESGRRVWWRISMFGLLLVPCLWWSRVYFTAAARGRNVDPFAIRDITDLLFGSPATGYPAFQLIRHYVFNHGNDFFYLIKYIASVPVPRFLWHDKPVDLDTILEHAYQLSENPSSFWFGELYLMFGPLSIPMAFVTGYVLYYFADRLRYAPSVFHRSLAAVLFMQSPTLFKNGFAVASLNWLVFTCALGFAWGLSVLGSQHSRERHAF